MLIHYKLDDSVVIDGQSYTVNASFDVILRVVDLLQDDGVAEVQKPTVALQMLIDESFSDYSVQERVQLVEAILKQYIALEEEAVQYDLAGNPMPTGAGESTEDLYDIKQDSERIYAAFMQVYGIDLIEQQGKLHWRKFRALLNNLPSGNALTRVIEIRGWSPADDKKKRSQVMREMQDKFRLERE